MLWQHSYADRIYTEMKYSSQYNFRLLQKYHPECTKMRHFPEVKKIFWAGGTAPSPDLFPLPLRRSA